MKRNFGGEIKIIVVGNVSTGNTCFVKQWKGGKFADIYKPTIVSEFGYRQIEVDNFLYQIQLWDIAGMDRNHSIAQLFLKDTSGVIILCSSDNEVTLQDTLKWKEAILDKCSVEQKKMPILLVQNKEDLIDEKDKKSMEKRIKKFGEEHDYVNSFMVSAKTKKNLDEAMNCIIAEIILQLKNNEQRQSNAALRDMLRYSTISESTEKESREAKCC